MKTSILVVTVIVGPLLLLAARSAAADQLDSGQSRIQSATASVTDRETYTQKAQTDIQGWQQKLRDFDEQADVKGHEVGHAAGDDLNKALVDAEVASRRLRTASGEEWTGAKSLFEQASRELAAAWDKGQPQDK